MHPSELKRRLHAGERVYGTLIVSPSPRWPAQVARMGLDFVFIDTEHIALGRHELSWMCQAYGALGLPPLVRIPSPDPFQASMALDGGAAGIIVPYVETAAQARELVGAVKFGPLKGRRLTRILAGDETPEPALAAYLERHNASRLLVLNIESRPALDQLDDILAVPGLDAVLIGPHDLSCSLGEPEAYGTAAFEEAVTTIFAKARAHGLGAGIHSWMGVEREATWARAGANLLIHEADLLTFARVVRDDLVRLRAALGDSPGGGSGGGPNI
jgi:4-hydroxy-2-oxoheptanedioate aldolase